MAPLRLNPTVEMGEAVRKQTAFRQLKKEYGIVGVDEATLRKDADVADFMSPTVLSVVSIMPRYCTMMSAMMTVHSSAEGTAELKGD